MACTDGQANNPTQPRYENQHQYENQPAYENAVPCHWVQPKERRGAGDNGGYARDIPLRDCSHVAPGAQAAAPPGGRNEGEAVDPESPGSQTTEVLNPLYASGDPGTINYGTKRCGWLYSWSRPRLVCVVMATTVMATLALTLPFFAMHTDYPTPDVGETSGLVRAAPKHAGRYSAVTRASMAKFPSVSMMKPVRARDEDETTQGDVTDPTRFTWPDPKIATEGTVGGGTKRMRKTVTFGSRGSEPGQFLRPRGLAVSRENEIYVTDSEKREVQVFNMEGAPLRQYPTVVSEGAGAATMRPWDVSADGEGRLWVVGSDDDHDEHAVLYTGYGRPLAHFNPDNSLFINGIASDPRTGRVAVTWSDGFQGRVDVYSPDGFLRMTLGPGDRLIAPTHVTVDSEGNILATDIRSHRVFLYGPDGGLVAKFGGYGTSGGRLYRPKGVAVTRSGLIAVADNESGRLVLFTRAGEFVRDVATGLPDMAGLAAGPDGQLVVVDARNRTVTVFTGY